VRIINKTQNAFTLVETVIVLAVIGAILSFGTIIDLNSFKGDALRAEEATILSALEKARSRSMANMFNTTHGVCYAESHYIIFRGRTACLPTTLADEIIPANKNFNINFPVIVFERLSGKVVPELNPYDKEVNISITDGIRQANIKVNNEGRISW
jgi:prepilin-type N-terminal cleavage/methylation domain-containing protein